MIKETPNTSYIDELSGDDQEFRQRVIRVIKSELITETSTYYHFMDQKNYIEAARAVHKLKHKIGIFGMTESYLFTEEFENALRLKKPNKKIEFSRILRKILIFSDKI